jgi:K+-transporting ATPase ATPase C chain
MKTFFSSLRILTALTILTGVIYPLAVWTTGRAFFHEAAEGSLIRRDNRVVGSALIAQKNTDPRYFQPRPSVGDYATVASGASNQPWTSAKLAASTQAAANDFRTFNQLTLDTPLPSDAITASGGGLDPHISSENARLQISRVTHARNLTTAQRATLDALVSQHTEGGNLTPSRVNVLRLNLALDAALR